MGNRSYGILVGLLAAWSAGLAGSVAAVRAGQGCDILIRGGTVYVGDGSDPLRADVAIAGDKIAWVGRRADVTASKEIDATGLAVAPGFINMLSWSGESLIADGTSPSELLQGVTTQIMGEGQSMGPLSPAMKRRRKAAQTTVHYDYQWDTLAGYLRWLQRRGIAQNVASFVGAGTVREYVMGLQARPATAAELRRMQRLVQREMRAGALGVGSALIYPPGCYADTRELIALSRVAARYGGMYISHIRSQGSRFVEAVQELLRISRQAGVPAEIYHFGAAGQENWPKLEQAIELIEQARRRGRPITANMHLYPAGCTGLTACLPPWCQAGGYQALLRRLQDPATRQRIASEVRRRSPHWDNPFHLVGSPDRMLLVHFENPRLRPYEGRTLADVAAERGQDPVDALIDLIAEDRSRVETVYFTDCEQNVRRLVRLPWISFGSDAASMSTTGPLAGYRTHPRAFGNFARLLGKYVRQERLISLQEAIRRLTGLPASNLGLDRRGLLRPGYFADVVVFDPRTIADRATFERPQQYAVGVRHVLVNGVPVVVDGRITGALPGRALWGPGRPGRKGPERSPPTAPGRPPSPRPSGLGNILGAPPAQAAPPTRPGRDPYQAARRQMVRRSLQQAEPPITNTRVLEAMAATPRHLFVAPKYRRYAYIDTVLPIGHGQTISPPYIVAYMTEQLDPQPEDRVLEIGTGSGYQAAVLAGLVREVYTIEIVPPLGQRAAQTLRRLGYSNVFVKIGDGYKGWPEKAPFDKIIVTCSPDRIPQPLARQLRDGGRMIIPVGKRYQQSFFLVQKRGGRLLEKRLVGTFFVPMTGQAERQRRDKPDGTRPAIVNGGFEEGTDVQGDPAYWYYHRRVSIQQGDAPEGAHYVLYSNDVPGRLAHSNQGFAVDGRRVRALELSFVVKTDQVAPGPDANHRAGVIVAFFDRNRALAAKVFVGPFVGTQNWTPVKRRIAVPPTARDAVIMIGLHGATGQIGFDHLRIAPLLGRGPGR